ncbi:type III secretion protein [Enterobacter sp. Ap-916]|uniref:type III secretion system HrpP C-terminal domain-containing protein n=1 Tax=Enterobacteriaceae TaxID=543 RepID=UPI001423D5C8|nr:MULTISPECIES: type III secretion system HrpP C-terminal domain-containing protein [unclassified Enterobacter]NIF60421.1 type III secretion protein [Enterobacter sp. Ap-867]NIG29997.1 type III secretion protein [Enterobacter sp. Ap-916]
MIHHALKNAHPQPRLWQQAHPAPQPHHQPENAPQAPTPRAPHAPGNNTPFMPQMPARSTSSSGRASDRQKLSRDEKEFSDLLSDDEPDPVMPILALNLFDGSLGGTEQPQQASESPSSALRAMLESHLIQGIEQQESLPARFSLLLPDLGEVVAQVTPANGDGLDIALGFSAEAWDKVRGFEQDGQGSLSRRLGKKVRLRFKRREAV